MAYGILNVIFAVGKIPPPVGAFPEIGFWFIVLAAITWVAVGAASAESSALAILLTFLAAGSTTAAIGELTGLAWLMTLTGWLFIISSIVAWYTGSALMLEEACGHEVWTLGKSKQSGMRVSTGMGEPGVIRGQA